MKVYLSGKITGEPNYKRLFAQAEIEVKIGIDKYAEVVNPCSVELSEEATWRDYMKADIKLLTDCDIVFMLKNWKHSKGARIEHFIAKKLGIPIIYGW